MSDNKKTFRKSKKNLYPIDFEHGKIPPQAIELEEAVIGALMIDNEALTTIIDIISAESFYKENHQEIFRSINSI